MMSYIALQILNAGGAVIPESHLKSLLFQVKESVMQSSHEVNAPFQFAHHDTPPIENPASALYEAELKATPTSQKPLFRLMPSFRTNDFVP